MIDLIEKEIFKSSNLGGYIANNSTLCFFKKLLKSENIKITNQSICGWDDGYCVRVLCVECKALKPISFDDGRLKFNEGDKFTLTSTVDMDEPLDCYGSTSISQIIHYANGDWDIRDYDYLDFDKEYVL